MVTYMGTPAAFSDTLSAVAALLWPLIVIGLVIALFPLVKRVLESRGFSIEIAGVKLTVQQASDQVVRQVEDLQAEVDSLKQDFKEPDEYSGAHLAQDRPTAWSLRALHSPGSGAQRQRPAGGRM